MVQSRIPAVSYLSLSEYLANPTAAQAIKSTGSVVVRDVIPDGLALAWARDISEAMSRRGGDGESFSEQRSKSPN